MEVQPKIELITSSASVSLTDISNFEIGVKITGSSRENLPVDLSGLTLHVNAVRSVAWDLAMQNGTLGNLRLAPGQTEIVLWNMGPALFESAGTYELHLFNKDELVAKREIRITNTLEK